MDHDRDVSARGNLVDDLGDDVPCRVRPFGISAGDAVPMPFFDGRYQVRFPCRDNNDAIVHVAPNWILEIKKNYTGDADREVVETTLAAQADPADMTLTVADDRGFEAYDTLTVTDGAKYFQGVVSSVAGGVVTLRSADPVHTTRGGVPTGQTYAVGSTVVVAQTMAVEQATDIHKTGLEWIVVAAYNGAWLLK